MSIRTIIEINHDFVSQLSPDDLEVLKRALISGDHIALKNGVIHGVRFLAQRHHADTITIKVE